MYCIHLYIFVCIPNAALQYLLKVPFAYFINVVFLFFSYVPFIINLCVSRTFVNTLKRFPSHVLYLICCTLVPIYLCVCFSCFLCFSFFLVEHSTLHCAYSFLVNLHSISSDLIRIKLLNLLPNIVNCGTTHCSINSVTCAVNYK